MKFSLVLSDSLHFLLYIWYNGLSFAILAIHLILNNLLDKNDFKGCLLNIEVFIPSIVLLIVANVEILSKELFYVLILIVFCYYFVLMFHIYLQMTEYNNSKKKKK